MITFNYLMAQALIVLNAKLKKENTARRIGGLFRDLLLFLQNLVLGMILKGELANEATIKAISNPTKGDTYRAIDTGLYWCYDGIKWNNIGELIPSNVATKNELSEIQSNINYSIRFANYDNILIEENYTIPGDERKAIKITFKAPNTLYLGIKDKAEQRIEFSNDTDYIIPYNCYQYYQISTNTIVVTAANVIQSFDDYICLANSHLGELVGGHLLIAKNRQNFKEVNDTIGALQSNVGVSLIWNNYVDGITVKEKQTDGYAVIVAFKAPLKFYCIRNGKAEQSITITENIEYSIYHNSFLYYDILNNEIIVSNKILDSVNYIMLANSHIGILTTGYFIDTLLRKQIEENKKDIPRGDTILINDEESIKVIENRNGSDSDASIFFPKGSKFFYQPIPYVYRDLIFGEDTEYIVPHNSRLYYEISTNSMIVTKDADFRPIQTHILLAYTRYGKIVSGYFVDLALRQKLKVLEDVNYTSNVEFISRECRVNGFPGNSLLGAKECKRVGINHIRVSVRYTSDGVFVLQHDATINDEARNADGSVIATPINVIDNTYNTLIQYDYGIRYGEKYRGLKIAKLEDMIKLCAGIGLTLTIELKDAFTADHANSICKMLAKYAMLDSVWICDWVSSSHNYLQYFISEYPDINIAFIEAPTKASVDKALAYKTDKNKVRLAMFISGSPDFDIDEDLPYYAAQKGISLNKGDIWDMTKVVKWFELGVRYIEVATIPYPYKRLNEYITNK